MVCWYPADGTVVFPGIVEPVEVADNGDQTHTVSYVPTREGPYSINVLYADEEIPRRCVGFPLLQHTGLLYPLACLV